MDFLASIAQFALVLAIVLLNGFFVAAEYAIVRVRATQIEPLVQKGVKRARLAQHLLAHLDTYLSASQLGITFTSLGLGWIGEPFVSETFRRFFELFGFIPEAWIGTLSSVVGFTTLTFLLIVLGELGPRWLAILYSQQATLLLARPLHIFYVIFRPFIWFLNRCADYLRAIGITPVNESDIAHSEEEMRLLLSRGRTISSTVFESS